MPSEKDKPKPPPPPPGRPKSASVLPKQIYSADQSLKPPPPPPDAPRAAKLSPARPSLAPPPRHKSTIIPPPPKPDPEDESVWRGVKLRKKRPMNNGCLRGALYFALICLASLILAVNIWSWANDLLALTKNEGTVTITIPDDYTYKSLGKQLGELGVIEHPWLFAMYCDYSKADKYIDPGERELDISHDYRALVHSMQETTEKGTVRIVFPEGITQESIVELLVENKVCERDALMEVITRGEFSYSFLEGLPESENRLEGYLFPDTYDFYMGESPKSVVNKFLSAYSRKLSKSFRERIEEMPYTMHEIITIASLIEAEAANIAEMKTIASVIYNRLNSNNYPYLEIDASILYVLERRKIKAEDWELDSPYNLRKHEGLPPGPICSPSINAIRAAIYPQKTGYYFYALTENKVHQFSKTLAEHNKVKADNPGIYDN